MNQTAKHWMPQASIACSLKRLRLEELGVIREVKKATVDVHRAPRVNMTRLYWVPAAAVG